MAAEPLTRDRVLDAAEDVLRRYGPAKATVVDVARALGVSHGTVYRHFASKAQLQDAVLERWLHRVVGPLDAVAREDGPAADRLRRWLLTLSEVKQKRAREDPDLFAAYAQLSQEARAVTVAHVAEMTRQIAAILADGIARGEFADAEGDVEATAAAVLAATTRFHHPAHASEWTREKAPAATESADGAATDADSVAAGASADTVSADTASADANRPSPASFDTASFKTASFDTASFDTVWRLLLLGLSKR